MASVSSVGKAQKFQFKMKTNFSTEARINFGELPETPAKVMSLQKLHISGHIETINILKKATLPSAKVSFQSHPSAPSFQTI